MQHWKIKAVALTTVLTALSGCKFYGKYESPYKRHLREQIDDKVSSDYSNDPTIRNEEKVGLMGAHVDAITVRNVHGTLGGKNPPHIRNNNPFLRADFLYWQADEDGLEYAYKSTVKNGVPRQELENPSFKWRPGYRVAFGYNFGNYDAWDLTAKYTYLYNKARGKVESSATQSVLVKWGAGLLGNTASKAAARWTLHFNTADLELGRNFFISKRIAMRPHMGARGGWIHQRYNTRYNDALFTFQPAVQGAATSVTAPTKFSAQNNYWGVGLRAGLDLMYHFSSCFSLVGQASGSILAGKFNVLEKYSGQTFVVPSPTGTPTLTNLNTQNKERLRRTRTNLEGAAGFAWENTFNNGFHLCIKALYEVAEWFDQNELFDKAALTDVSPIAGSTAFRNDQGSNLLLREDGDLGLHGATFSVELDF